jgi:hypothetical protein
MGSDYIKRAFAACPSSKHDALSKQLEVIIREAHIDGQLRKIDWDNRPLPR